MKWFMTDESTLLRIEAMLVSLRDQIDHLTERVDARLDDHERQIARLTAKPTPRKESRDLAEQ